MTDSKEVKLGDRGWAFQPHYWNGSEWVEAKGVCLNSTIPKKTLSVISYNVWFGNFQVRERMQALGQIMRTEDPDLIALQEVTAPILQLLLSQGWAHQYYVSDPFGEQLARYGVAIMSKYRVDELILRDFPSRMGRKALVSSIKLRGTKEKFVFGTFHLESYPNDTEFRKQQLELYQKLVEGFPQVVLCGDTNFAQENEERSLGDRFKDAWVDLYPDEPGVTFDTKNNKMNGKAAGFFAQKRIDRCFYTHETLKPLEMRILGTEAFADGAWPSDHFGIRLDIELVGSSDNDDTNENTESPNSNFTK